MDRATWDQRFARYEGLRLLFEADDQWGPLNVATLRQTLAYRTDDYERADAQHGAQLRRHMATIYDPLIEAGLELVRTPAPDLAAVRAKHEACNADGYRLIDYEDGEGELFGLIEADVRRLLGEAQ